MNAGGRRMSAKLLRRIAGRMLLPVVRVACRAYVPGPTVADAMQWVRRMERQDIACTLGYFNAEDDVPDAIVRQIHAAMEALAGARLHGYVSIKPPPLRYEMPEILRIASKARQLGQLLHFDSHGPQTAQPTLDLLEATLREYPLLGLTVPGRWVRSPDDAAWAAERGVRVRVVKGQWACPERPDVDPRGGFLAVIDRLAGRAREVAVATHDVELAREAIGRLRRAGTACEMEMLCGLPRRELIALARELGVTARLYVPFGQAWQPYALDQALQNPRVILWTLRDALVGLRRG